MTQAKHPGRKWSAEVAKRSDALDIEADTFKARSAEAVAESLKRSALRSHSRKSRPFRSAMSMLTFYINRAGRTLTPARRRQLEAAKNELRKTFGKEPKS